METKTQPDHTGSNGAESVRKESPMASTLSILTLAGIHTPDAPMRSSAELCLQEAHDATDDASARRWALKSLAYSVGVFHADYQWAAA